MGREVEWESSERTVQVGGADLRLVDVGDPDAERVVVLLHGIAASWRWFTPVIPALSERARVLAVDLPGFGRSAMPPAGLTFDAMAAAVDELADQLGLGAVDVVGHSMGSIVGTRLAVDHPRRVRRLVLTGGPVLALTDLPRHPLRTLTSEPRAVTTLVKQLATIGLPLPSAAADVVAESAFVRRVLMRGYVAHPEDPVARRRPRRDARAGRPRIAADAAVGVHERSLSRPRARVRTDADHPRRPGPPLHRP
ncbi:MULTISPECIES: alpha/beta hydrolase [unclassified Aeromicrobium]|jgi:pimeloyl-ACP methyl ester carboxylesterase|uniref:alpha/beta fold hydrolase n=1 Tax=unclassified Aeromicrobium TaxID=2633570 RepID=UPI000A88B411|nr:MULTISPECIES: alpha/beta hydrolase [unclassified Aeromicrobium]